MSTVRDPLLGTTRLDKFTLPMSVRAYGYRNGRPIVQEDSPSGHLLPWEALDDEAEALVSDRPARYVVTGEYVRADGVRFPVLAVSDAYMKWQGYERDGHRWKRGSHD
jgi:hypothetical protein